MKLKHSMAVLALLVLFQWGAACGRAEAETHWEVSAAPGLDAVLLLGAVSGDLMQADIYGEEIARLRSEMSEEGLAALERLDQTMRVEHGQLTGPVLAYYLSANDLVTLDDILASAADPTGRLLPGLIVSPGWEAGDEAVLMAVMPDVEIAVEALRETGYEAWYAAEIAPLVEAAIARNHEAVSPYDIIPEQERLLGRPLDARIEILIVQFGQPYGIRIMGQRFIAWQGWDAGIQLRTAAHEIFHPPFNLGDPQLRDATQALAQDPWMRAIVEQHDPAFGYNSFVGIVNEDSTQALDQLVSERLGFARDPGLRWNQSDGGMHMLAAALYQAMKEDGFGETGGTYSDWLISAFARGLLAPEEVRRRATLIVGPKPVQRWADLADSERPGGRGD